MEKIKIEFKNLTKKFVGITANDDVNFKIREGSIHAIIGENGAGKSTLMSMLFGMYKPTSGQILIDEKAVSITDPNVANDLGIGMVHQHFKLVDIYSNLENIIMGDEIASKGGILRQGIATKKIKKLQEDFNLDFDLKQNTAKATVGTQQKVEIMKMLYRGNEILIFDEPTAVLSPQEITGFLKSLTHFKKLGKTIIFISHKLNEIKEAADYATVIRAGKVIDTFDVKKTTIAQMATAMVGKKVVMPKNSSKKEPGEVILSVKDINTHGKKKGETIKDIAFDVKAGEILAIAGVEGNGQETLEYILSGIKKPKSGKIMHLPLNDKNNSHELVDINKYSVTKRIKKGITYIPGDRHRFAMVLDFTIAENMILRRMWDKQFNKAGFINRKKMNSFFKEVEEKFDVRSSKSNSSTARSMSGGNQQKAIVGRELLTPHNFVIVVQPTRGLDVGAIKNIHEFILKEKEEGKAILLISYELDEVLALSDRILVMNQGVITGEVQTNKAKREEIGLLMAGITKNKK